MSRTIPQSHTVPRSRSGQDSIPETSAEPAVTGVAQRPLPCEPIEPTAQPHGSGRQANIQGQHGRRAGQSRPLAAGPAAERGVAQRLSPDILQAILRAVSSGVPDAAAAQLAGIPGQTWRRWRLLAEQHATHWPDGSPIADATQTFLRSLSSDLANARAEFEAHQVESIAQAAEQVNERTGLRDWRANAWLLNNHPAYRQTYREFRELHVEQRGQVSHEHRLVRDLEDSQLLELAPADYRELV